jgi:tRNA1Val (adenine37-N6)-methyltransferase
MSVFRFKQFAVDQTGCAMKVNTDGVLLGALADAGNAHAVLDIGTGTGVIALMLAQRFAGIRIDAVELDEAASRTAAANFGASPFTDRIQAHHLSFQAYFTQYPDQKYDLIISNPPFYINSLHSPGADKTLAKHANESFFDELIAVCCEQLNPSGELWLILPTSTAAYVKDLLLTCALQVQQVVNIRSYPHSDPHRQVLRLGFDEMDVKVSELIIYAEPKIYTHAYHELLKDFLTIF